MAKNNIENQKVWSRSLDDIMSESFGKYAKYIIQDRALPDIRDGLKPVQRRILYAMNELKIHYDKPYKKSARTVGEVIGKYHPHGDSSIYEAMVRMAQEWKNNIPLLDMQGNKGSIDGDAAAAMRYTEARLSKFGQWMMEGIDKDTVKFIPNFDDSEYEPSVLPSLLPNILINGATGIAAGYATNIPPFNFEEVMNGIVYRINNPESSLKEISSIILGPDFPTGGIILGKDGINDIFVSGKGKFFIRARIEQEYTRANSKTKRLIVKEIPYDTNKAMIVKALDELRVNNEIPGFKEVRDDSDKSGISIVLEFDTDKDLEIIKSILYKKTQLQISYTANIVLIKDRKPVQAGLLEILDSFINHANEIVIKAATFDLNKALLRKEILEGLIKAISEIDLLVNLIKSSKSKDEAKQKIEAQFQVNERQSEAIVNLRLYVLTSYDTEKLKKEYDELLLFIEDKKRLINDTKYRNQHICQVLNSYKKDMSSKRKSQLEEQIDEIEIKTEDIIEEVKGTCIVTRDNYIKFIGDSSIQEVDLTRAKIKETDMPVDIFQMSTLDHLVCLTNKGRCIIIPAHRIKMTRLRENGIHINEMVTIDSYEKTIFAFAINKYSDISTEILVATKNSLVKRMAIADFNLTKNSKSTSYINLKNGDEVVSVYLLKKEMTEVIAISENGYANKYDIAEIPVVGRTASGVKNMNLKANDLVACCLPIPNDETFLLIISNRGGKRIHINDVIKTSRGKLGKRIFAQVESNPYIVNSACIVSGRTTIYLQTDLKMIDAKVSDIPISEITSRMNSFSKVDAEILRATYVEYTKNIVAKNENNCFASLADTKDETKTSKSTSKIKEVEIEEPMISNDTKKEFFMDEDGNLTEKKVETFDDELNENQSEELEKESDEQIEVSTTEDSENYDDILIDDNQKNEVVENQNEQQANNSYDDILVDDKVDETNNNQELIETKQEDETENENFDDILVEKQEEIISDETILVDDLENNDSVTDTENEIVNNTETQSNYYNETEVGNEQPSNFRLETKNEDSQNFDHEHNLFSDYQEQQANNDDLPLETSETIGNSVQTYHEPNQNDSLSSSDIEQNQETNINNKVDFENQNDLEKNQETKEEKKDNPFGDDDFFDISDIEEFDDFDD